MMLDQPVARKRVGRADLEMVALDGQEAAGADPLIDDGGGELVGDGIEEATPKAIQHRSSPHVHTELSTGVDSFGRLVRWEYPCRKRRLTHDTHNHASLHAQPITEHER